MFSPSCPNRSMPAGPRLSPTCVSIGASEPVPISILAWASPEATRARSADRARSRQGKGTDVGVVQAWIGNSHHERNWYWRVHEGRLLRTKAMRRIGLLGVAYKEDTQSTKNSAALAFSRDCVQIQLFLSPSCLTPCSDPLACAEGADALVLATPWPQYHKLCISYITLLIKCVGVDRRCLGATRCLTTAVAPSTRQLATLPSPDFSFMPLQHGLVKMAN